MNVITYIKALFRDFSYLPLPFQLNLLPLLFPGNATLLHNQSGSVGCCFGLGFKKMVSSMQAWLLGSMLMLLGFGYLAADFYFLC